MNRSVQRIVRLTVVPEYDGATEDAAADIPVDEAEVPAEVELYVLRAQEKQRHRAHCRADHFTNRLAWLYRRNVVAQFNLPGICWAEAETIGDTVGLKDGVPSRRFMEESKAALIVVSIAVARIMLARDEETADAAD